MASYLQLLNIYQTVRKTLKAKSLKIIASYKVRMKIKFDVYLDWVSHCQVCSDEGL